MPSSISITGTYAKADYDTLDGCERPVFSNHSTKASKSKTIHKTHEPQEIKKSLSSRILGKLSKIFNTLGLLGDIAGVIIGGLTLIGISICPPLAAIGIIGIALEVIGGIFEILSRATDQVQDATSRKTAQATQIGGTILELIASSIVQFVPMANVIRVVVRCISGLGSLVSVLGTCGQLVSDYNKRRILLEYGDNAIGRTIHKGMSLVHEAIMRIRKHKKNPNPKFR